MIRIAKSDGAVKKVAPKMQQDLSPKRRDPVFCESALKLVLVFRSTPLAGRDCLAALVLVAAAYFNSHAPCGARPASTPLCISSARFQLTRPLRGATTVLHDGLRHVAISTHTPLAGRDLSGRACASKPVHFNSHAPCGARPEPAVNLLPQQNFNSHAPCGARRKASD